MSGLELTNPKGKAIVIVSVKWGLDSCPRQVSTSGSIHFVLPIGNCDDDACFFPAPTEMLRLGLFFLIILDDPHNGEDSYLYVFRNFDHHTSFLPHHRGIRFGF
jgi:hypothetical protein